MPAFMFNPEFWVLVAFVIAVGFLIYKVKDMVAGALDARAATIKAELDEAQRLREEAQTRLAEFQRKQRDALKEADEIVAQAKIEAERSAAQAARDLDAAIERRKKMALEKIAMTEAKAIADIRNSAVDLAISALARVLVQDLDAARKSAMIDEAIAALPPTLH
jgi:F-type H+-transporting ATPase subunit b